MKCETAKNYQNTDRGNTCLKLESIYQSVHQFTVNTIKFTEDKPV